MINVHFLDDVFPLGQIQLAIQSYHFYKLLQNQEMKNIISYLIDDFVLMKRQFGFVKTNYLTYIPSIKANDFLRLNQRMILTMT